MEERKYISEIISEDEIDTWDDGNVVIISADTDSGKSHFIKHKLAGYAKKKSKKILMLCHRKLCADQFKYEVENIGNDDVISIMTYQKLEFTRDTTILDKYDYIVCDEYHYFFDDSEFNNLTQFSFDAIMSKTSAVRIFMSATADNVEKYIKEEYGDAVIRKYQIERNYDRIRRLIIFTSDELESFAKQIIDKDLKAIFFIDNVDDALKLYKKFSKNSLFCCSPARKEHKYVDDNKINKMIQNEKFDENLLITTTVLDTGVNIKDKSIRNIIVSVKNPYTIKQCIGRRRIDYDDYTDMVSVYIKDIPNRLIKLYINHIKNSLKSADYLMNNGEEKYVNKYGYDRQNSVVYLKYIDSNVVPIVNQMKYNQKQFLINTYKEMIKLDEKHGYRIAVSKILKRKEDGIDKVIYHDNSIETFLNSNIDNIFLTKQEKLEFAEKLGITDRYGRKCNGIYSINGYLNDCFQNRYEIVVIPNYYIKDEHGKRIKRYQNVWKLCYHYDEKEVSKGNGIDDLF